MSRFSGPQGDGAARKLQAVRRAEAETRQAAERARDKARAEQRTRRDTIRPLTDEEVNELLRAALRVNPVHLINELRRHDAHRNEGT